MNEQPSFNYEKELELLKNSFDFDFIALALVQSAEHRFAHKWEYAIGNRSDRFRRIILQSGKGIAGHVFKTGKPLHVKDAEEIMQKDELYNYALVISEGLTSFGAIPLYKCNDVQGVLLVAYRGERKLEKETFLELQQAVGSNFGPYYNKEMVTRW